MYQWLNETIAIKELVETISLYAEHVFKFSIHNFQRTICIVFNYVQWKSVIWNARVMLFYSYICFCPTYGISPLQDKICVGLRIILPLFLCLEEASSRYVSNFYFEKHHYRIYNSWNCTWIYLAIFIFGKIVIFWFVFTECIACLFLRLFQVQSHNIM